MNDGAGLIQTLQGTIVAVRPVPEPSSWLIIAIGMTVALVREAKS